MKQHKFSPDWDEERVRRVLEHYETQTEEEAVAEDEGMWDNPSQTIMEIRVNENFCVNGMIRVKCNVHQTSGRTG